MKIILRLIALSYLSKQHQDRRARCGVSDSQIVRGVPGDDDDVKLGGLREAITR
jgi:hypothetical protein